MKCFCGFSHYSREREKVTQDELKNEAQARRFLLGEMSGDERGAFEEKFIADELLFEQARVVEDELIESYIRGTLPLAEREKFERSFLTTERRRSRVAFTRTMLGKLSEQKEIAAVKKTETAAAAPSVWDSIAGFFKTPSLAFGAALAILLTAFGGWFLLKNSSNQEIARQTNPTPATTELIQSNSNQTIQANQNSQTDSNSKKPEATETTVGNSGQKKQTPSKNSNTQKEETTLVNPVLALFAGTVRSEGKTKELNLPKNANNVLLQLNLESRDYKIYLAEIVNADGETVSKSDRLKVKNSKINLSVPAAKLQRGDYRVKLSALNPQNETESVADYAFRINRK